MAAITIRNLPQETHNALKARAKANKRSTEAEVRSILDNAVSSSERVKLGSVLASIGQETEGIDLDVSRDKNPREPLDLT